MDEEEGKNEKERSVEQSNEMVCSEISFEGGGGERAKVEGGGGEGAG